MDLRHWRFLIRHRDAWSWLTWYTRFINHKLKKKIFFRITNQPSRGGTLDSGEMNPLLHHHVSIMGLHLVRYLSLPFAPSFYHGLAPTPGSHIILFVPWPGVAYSFPDPSNARRYRGSCGLTELLAHNTNFYGHNLIIFRYYIRLNPALDAHEPSSRWHPKPLTDKITLFRVDVVEHETISQGRKILEIIRRRRRRMQRCWRPLVPPKTREATPVLHRFAKSLEGAPGPALR